MNFVQPLRHYQKIKSKLIKPKVTHIEVRYGNLGSKNHVAFQIPVKHLPNKGKQIRSY